ncbi:MAG TPA: hypothetical protein VE870_11345 [Bacteroidales bacterium]|nr:hypothetical protein [Bacteroidales bacterium]
MQQFQDDIMKNRLRLEKINQQLSARIDELEKRILDLEEMTKSED